MNRRDFLLQASTVAATTLTTDSAFSKTIAPKEISKVKGLSILQGLTTPTSTQLSICLSKDEKVYYTLTDVETGRVYEPSSERSVIFKTSETRVDKIKFTELELGHEYQLLVRTQKRNKVLDERFLKTVDLNRHGVKIGIMSCMLDLAGNKEKIWRSAEAANVDYIFFVGDAVYGDLWIFHGPGFLWSRYVESREKIPFYRWKNLKPVIAVWDDHDFGKNNRGGDYKHKNSAYHHFQTFFAQEPDGEYLFRGYANSSYFRAFQQNFVFFDNRFYRGLQNSDGSIGFFGHDQINWMTNAVGSSANPTWVMNGSPLFGRLEKQGTAFQPSAPEEFDYFSKKLSGWSSPILFAAGDLHYSEVSTIGREHFGYETLELISSCMHSTKRKKFYDNPNPKLAGYLEENFVLLEQIGVAGEPIWHVKSIAKGLQIAFELEIQI